MRCWLVGLVGLVGLNSPAIAQSIVPTGHTVVEQRATDYTISGGQRSGDGINLFHGFERFNLDTGEQANFLVPAGVANVLGRVSGGEASLIKGQLQLLGSHADLFLLNPAGVIFGNQATLALPGSFLATTANGLTFENGTFSAIGSGDYAALVGEPIGLEFWADAGGALVNSGDLTVTPGASLSFIGSSVTHTGHLLSPGGTITLAAVPNSHHVRLSSAGSVLGYAIAPHHLVSGFEPLSLPNLLTNSSVSSATGLVVTDGRIQLAGADISVTPATVLSTGDIDVSGVTGGNLQLLGEQVGVFAGTVLASGQQNGGQIWLGGNPKGTGLLPNARATYVAPTATIRADAQTHGSGGRIIVWSEESSRIHGTLSAVGRGQNGNGGFIETSSRGFLDVTQAPDVSAVQGSAGLWLLDPFDIEIRNNSGNNVSLPTGSPFTATGSVAILDIGVLNAALANGGNVVVETTTAGGTASGNITLTDPLVYTAGAGTTLQLSAAGNINIQASISPGTGSGPLNLQLQADADGQKNGVVEIGSQVLLDTFGGSLSLTGNGEQTSLAAGVSLLADSTLQTRGGSITITGHHSNNAGVLVGTNTSIDAAETAPVTINGVSQTGIGIDLVGALTTSNQLTLDGQTGSTTLPAIRSSSPLMDNHVVINGVGDIEIDSVTAGTGIDITTNRLLRVTNTNSANQSLVTSDNNSNIRIRHGGGTQTPFVVGDAAMNGTRGAIATDTTTLSPVRSFSTNFSQGTIRISTPGASPLNCVDGCDDLDDDFSDSDNDDIADSDFGDDDILSGDDGFDDDGGHDENDNEDGENEDNDDIESEEFESEYDSYVEILDNSEITAEELASKETDFAQEYTQYLGISADFKLPLPDIQQKLNQVAIETGYTPGIVYIDFVRDRQAQAKQVLEFSQEHYSLELVLITADSTHKQILTDATQADVQKVVTQLQNSVVNPTLRRRYLQPAQKLHSWLIAPLEPLLKKHTINHLAFVLPTGLRSLPLAALHNGESFLVERYSLGIMPSVSLTNLNYSDVRPDEVLAVGASTFADQPDLPAVPLELKTIAENLWPGRFFLNEAFTPERILANRRTRGYRILHLATHGEFRAGDPSNSYIQFWDRRITLNQLSTLSLDNPPVDFLVLSACRTALGSREAEMGFAGLAVQAGVKTAMASLWRVDDIGTAGLMTEFYAKLRHSTMRSEALRQAQIAMIRGNVTVDAGELTWTGGTLTMPPVLDDKTNRILDHPFYWAAFTLIGSPW